jgi:hypothetical protein
MRSNSIQGLLANWRRSRTSCYVLSATVIILSAVAIGWFWSESFYGIVAISLLGLIVLAYHRHRTEPDLPTLTAIVNQQHPELEYSGSLLTADGLSPLQELQRDKVAALFEHTDFTLAKPIVFCIATPIVAVLSMLCLDLGSPSGAINQSIGPITVAARPDSTGTVELTPHDSVFFISVKLYADYPAYTNKADQRLQHLDFTIPEGSTITWSYAMTGRPNRSFMLFSDGDTINLNQQNRLSRSFKNSDNYRYGLVDSYRQFMSDYHSVEVVKDQAPTIQVTGIDEYVRLDWAPDHQVAFNMDINDDYGLIDGRIIATVAKGQGESVKFREKEFDLKGFQSGRTSYNGSHSFSTQAFDMEPGDELYFYVAAKDNCPYRDQMVKSATFFVAIEDTTTYEWADNASLQVDVMPEFFRSQRQIIIDSEHLLSIKDQISVDSFNRMSNELGFDQKQLRLKYGQFLGEENESGIAIENEIELEDEDDHDHDHHNHDHDHDHDHDKNSILSEARDLLSSYMHDHDHEEEEGLLLSTKGTVKEEATNPSWVRELAHNHDSEEEATFHDISVKSKLRAAMSEMWDSELHLRLYDPATSLPYQHRSLKLLQEIKNHARIYVHRIGFDPPVIKEQEKRLSGDLDEIENSAYLTDKAQDDVYIQIKQIAESMSGESLDLVDQLATLQRLLATLAIDRLEILPLLSKLQGYNSINQTDVEGLRSELLKVIPTSLRTNTIAAPVNSHRFTQVVAKSTSTK